MHKLVAALILAVAYSQENLDQASGRSSMVSNTDSMDNTKNWGLNFITEEDLFYYDFFQGKEPEQTDDYYYDEYDYDFYYRYGYDYDGDYYYLYSYDYDYDYDYDEEYRYYQDLVKNDNDQDKQLSNSIDFISQYENEYYDEYILDQELLSFANEQMYLQDEYYDYYYDYDESYFMDNLGNIDNSNNVLNVVNNDGSIKGSSANQENVEPEPSTLCARDLVTNDDKKNFDEEVTNTVNNILQQAIKEVEEYERNEQEYINYLYNTNMWMGNALQRTLLLFIAIICVLIIVLCKISFYDQLHLESEQCTKQKSLKSQKVCVEDEKKVCTEEQEQQELVPRRTTQLPA
eukprot:TRINITY_DN8150_c0_g1_i1.p2 TRINITY_DN8150_c0_g1~~TRINITY_DN8150_c0_g1_i1.p2  ORF type:complete len:362 (+),score=40.41 TRINITY_DN8150_c0_g1_i1:51-1088(+)